MAGTIFRDKTMNYSRLVDSDAAVLSGDRAVKYVFSDETVARDNHSISTAGWQLDNFRKNPVFLWAHDDTVPPIGRVTEIFISGKVLRGTVKYASRDENPFADTIYQLVRGNFLNAVSVSWAALEWAYTKDRSRPGGIDFKKQELWEVSQVPVPALPSALATARSRGIDTVPVYKWAENVLDRGRSLLPRPQVLAIRAACQAPAAITRRVPQAKVEADVARHRKTLSDLDMRISTMGVHPDILRYRTTKCYPVSGAADEERHRKIREAAARAYQKIYGRS